MDAERNLKVPWVIQKATEADNVVRAVMKDRVVPIHETAAAIRNKREWVREANRLYYPLSEDKTK